MYINMHLLSSDIPSWLIDLRTQNWTDFALELCCLFHFSHDQFAQPIEYGRLESIFMKRYMHALYSV